MRVFFEADGSSRLGAAPDAHFTRIGDEWLAARNERAAAALAQFAAHDQRHLFARSSVDGRDYARAPIRTQLFVSGDSLLDGLTAALARRRARAR